MSLLAKVPSILRKTGSLGVLHALNHVPPLLALAFVSRALGPEPFGIYAAMLAAGAYLALLVDFGFNVTGTRSAAMSHSDRARLSLIFGKVLVARLFLTMFGALAALALLASIDLPKGLPGVAAMVVVQVIATSLMPTWLFVGLQAPERLVLPFAVCRVAPAVAAAVWVSSPADLGLYAGLNAAGAVALLLWALAEVYRLGIGWARPSVPDVKSAIRESSSIFGASVAINAYTTSSPLIVAAILGPAAAGQFAIADRVRQVVLGILTPASQALFPVACRAADSGAEADKRARRHGFVALLLASALLSVLLAFLAGRIVALLGGRTFAEASTVLRIMSPVPLLVTISTLLGTHVLVAHGYRREFLWSATLVALVSVPTMILFARSLGLGGAATSVLATEMVAVIILVVVMRRKGLPVAGLVTP